MFASEKSLRELLTGNLQFVVPIYQRTYDWGEDHCRQLYQDIVHAGQSDDDPTYFMGAITYYTQQESIPNVSRHQLIDGQQRITTLMLLLAALKRELSNQIQQPIVIDQILYNSVEPKNSDRYLKMKLNREDNVAFEEIIKNGQTDRSGNISANYDRFCKWLLQDKTPDSFRIIWRGILKLIIVHIAAGGKDNAQRIFESMNSTGLDLSTTDLVQNHLLMKSDLNEQEEIYNEHWHPMEKIFEDTRGDFDNYLRHYLIMKQRQVITKNKLYQKFKKYAGQHSGDILSDLHKYAKYYACLLYPERYKSSSNKLNLLIGHIHEQNTDVAHPLLLKIISDFENKLISENSATELFTLIDSYLLRCAVAGTAKNLNRAIPVIMSKLDENDYAESIKAAVLERRGKDRFPSDRLFKRNFMDKEFYQSDRVSMYILKRLTEKYQDTSALKLDVLTIEHIMPQKLSEGWKTDLGDNYDEIHNTHLRQIGNLTLTRDNSTLGNNIFSEKQRIYAGSEVKMTAALAGPQYKRWSVDEIIGRSQQLADEAVKIWKCPDGYSPDTDGESDDEEQEEDHLDGTNVTLLWSTLKNAISSKCPNTIFEMKQRYANFKIQIPNSDKYSLVCSIRALKHKIYVVYNTSISEKIIPISSFVNDISGVRHLGTGDLRSQIYNENDVHNAVDLIERIAYKKLQG